MAMHEVGPRADASAEHERTVPRGERPSSARLARIRARVEAGFYHDPSFAAVLAERLLSVGALEQR